jgi:hypothetical protein
VKVAAAAVLALFAACLVYAVPIVVLQWMESPLDADFAPVITFFGIDVRPTRFVMNYAGKMVFPLWFGLVFVVVFAVAATNKNHASSAGASDHGKEPELANERRD